MKRLEISSMPVLAAPMAGGPTTPELVAAAGRAGSFGFLAAGYRSAGQLAADIAQVRGSTQMFGVNLFVPDRALVDQGRVLAYRDLIAPAAERAGVELGVPRWEDDDDWRSKIDLLSSDPVPWVSFTFGLPDAEVVSRLRRAGIRLIMTVTSVDEALLAADLVPDALIAQSAQAGGHRASFDQRRPVDGQALPELVAAIRSSTGLPVIAAGGIGVREDVAAALAAGAEAVQAGTALLLADEAGTRPVHRRAIENPSATTAPMRAFTGRVARGITNAFSERYDGAAPPGYPAIHYVTAPLRRWAAEHDNTDYLHLWAGTGHRHARRGSAGDLLTALVP